MHLLYHLVCHCQASTPLTTVELTALLDDCHQYYATRAVTGLLLYRPDGQMLQVLEGEEGVLRQLYEQQAVDLPHFAHFYCLIVEEGPWARRSFPDWHMSFVPEAAVPWPTATGFVALSSLPTLLPQWAPTRPTLVHRFLEFAAPYDETGDPDRS